MRTYVRPSRVGFTITEHDLDRPGWSSRTSIARSICRTAWTFARAHQQWPRRGGRSSWTPGKFPRHGGYDLSLRMLIDRLVNATRRRGPRSLARLIWRGGGSGTTGADTSPPSVEASQSPGSGERCLPTRAGLTGRRDRSTPRAAAVPSARTEATPWPSPAAALERQRSRAWRRRRSPRRSPGCVPCASLGGLDPHRQLDEPSEPDLLGISQLLEHDFVEGVECPLASPCSSRRDPRPRRSSGTGSAPRLLLLRMVLREREQRIQPIAADGALLSTSITESQLGAGGLAAKRSTPAGGMRDQESSAFPQHDSVPRGAVARRRERRRSVHGVGRRVSRRGDDQAGGA